MIGKLELLNRKIIFIGSENSVGRHIRVFPHGYPSYIGNACIFFYLLNLWIYHFRRERGDFYEILYHDSLLFMSTFNLKKIKCIKNWTGNVEMDAFLAQVIERKNHYLKLCKCYMHVTCETENTLNPIRKFVCHFAAFVC